MTRTRTFRLVSIAVVFAFVLTLAGVPGTAGAATAADLWSRAQRTHAHALKAAIVSDDNIAGAIDTSLPVSVTDSLDALADPPLDGVDVYRVHLEKYQRLVATLTVDPDAIVLLAAFGPTAVDIWTANPVQVSDPNNVLRYIAPAAGDYYVAVVALWPMPDLGYPGWAGPYTLDAEAITPTATAITIKTAATTTYWRKTVTLSGAVTPFGMVGSNIVAYVMKPGKTYWTYSSNRTVYNLGGKAAWQYKYYFKAGMTKGYYKFKAVVPDYRYYKTSTSPTTVSIRLR